MASGRKHIMLGTAGHVDHGKSALVKLLTGCETDTLAEEKARGLTIDLGFAPCRLRDDRLVGIIDVPGHVDFIRNMVAGAHGLDLVLFVVAADDGIMPQTHEHLHILTLMGVRHGLVALTKIDLVEPSRRDTAITELRQLLAGTFLEQAPICPLSNVTGEGFDNFLDELNQTTDRCEERSSSGLFRLWVEDVFSIKGAGSVLTGIPSAGSVHPGDSLRLLPGGTEARLRRMQVYGEDATEGMAGECVALNMPDIPHEQARRGMVLFGGDKEALQPVSMVEGELRLLSTLGAGIRDLLEVHFHVGTAMVQAQVALLEAAELKPGEKQMVQLRLSEQLPLVPGERFVLRANMMGSTQSGLLTIGGGRIVATSNQKLRRRKQWTLGWLSERLSALDDRAQWTSLMLKEARQPLTLPELARKCLRQTSEISPVIGDLLKTERVLRLGSDRFLHSSVVEDTANELFNRIESFHAANPKRAGIAPEELTANARVAPDVAKLALAQLQQSGRIQLSGTVLARKGWVVQLPSQESMLSAQVEETFRRAGFAMPTSGEVAVLLKQPLPKVESSIRLLVDRAVLARLDERFCLHSASLESARNAALRLFTRNPTFSTMQFRDELQVSRKYAVPILDYLDKIRFTARSGHDRSPGVEAKKWLASKGSSPAHPAAPPAGSTS